MPQKMFLGNLRGHEHLGDPCLDGRILLKGILNKRTKIWSEFMWVIIGSLQDYFEHGYKYPSSVKSGDFLTSLMTPIVQEITLLK